MSESEVKCKGLVLDGHCTVGDFDDVSVINQNGLRIIKNLRIKTQYVDVVQAQAVKDLEYLYLAETENSDTVVLVDRVGFGQVFGSFMVSEPYVTFKLASFVAAPDRKGNHNAN